MLNIDDTKSILFTIQSALNTSYLLLDNLEKEVLLEPDKDVLWLARGFLEDLSHIHIISNNFEKKLNTGLEKLNLRSMI